MKNRNWIVLFGSLILITLVVLFNSKKFERKIVKKSQVEIENEDKNLINTPQSLKVPSDLNKDPVANSNTPNKKVYETKEEKFEIYDRMEKDWLKKAQEALGEKDFNQYLDMRSRCDKEKEKAYQAYHDYLRAKYGNNFKYNISEDQSINEKKINQRYLNELLKLVGEEKIKMFLKIRDDFNENSRRNSNGKSVIQIDF